MIKPVADVIIFTYIASAISVIDGFEAAANSRSNITKPIMVPTKPNSGAIRAITESTGRFFSIA